MAVRAAYLNLAIQMQEAADAMSSNDIRSSLRNAIQAAHKDAPGHQNHWHDYVDHTGDENSGDVVYTCDPDGDGDCDYMMAPYSKGTDKSDDDHELDMAQAHQVAQRTSWEPVGDDADGYAAMEAAKIYTAGGLPICERFVSKKERSAAPSGSFAGKGKSFPILKAADVAAAASSIGRAGAGNYSTDVIKRNIIRIAKEKGFEASLPKSWQDGGDPKKESAVDSGQSGTLKLIESSPFPVDMVLREAFSPGRMIKLIAPGKGSTAYYTEAALKQAAADRIFAAGTPMRIDHPTRAEESARPEGSVRDWGAVLASDAVYREDGAAGPGLYATIKTFSDHAKLIEEKGPYAGVSIRANGNAVVESGKPVMREGVPVLREFTSAEGADMVTRAGAGGMFLNEAARSANQGADDMTADEAKKLIEAATAPLRERALRGDAREEATRLLESVTLPPAAKAKIIERSVASLPIKDGELDLTKFREAVVREAKSEGEYLASLGGGHRVIGMGIASAVPALKPEEIAAREARGASELASDIKMYESFGLSKRGAELAAKGREAA